MKRIATLIMLSMLGIASKSYAASVAFTISSTTFVNGVARSDVLVLNPNESLTYTLTGSATGVMLLQKSIDGSNYTTIQSTTNNRTGTFTGAEYSQNLTSFYRWSGSTMTGAGSFQMYLSDNDDFVNQVVNNKKVPSVQFYDDTIRLVLSKGFIMSLIAPSTATNSGGIGASIPMYLAGSTAAYEGSVLIATSPTLGFGASVIVSSGTDLPSVVGIAKGSASTGTLVDMYYNGFVQALTTGTIIPGDLLGTTNIAGYLKVTTSSATAVGTALAGGVTAGGLTKIKMK